MKTLFKFDYVDGQFLARALAISLVVMNHAISPDAYISLAGGMLTLLFIAGYNLTRFSKEKSDQELIIYYIKYVSKIVVPCFFIVCFYFIFTQKFEIDEFLFYSNWDRTESIPWLPVWYPQMLLQSVLLIVCLFWLMKPARFIEHNLLLFTVISFIIAISIYPLTALFQELGIADVQARIPFSYLWCLEGGGIVFAIVTKGKFVHKLVAVLLCVIVLSMLFYFDFLKETQAFIFITLIGLFILNPRLRLPTLLTIGVRLIANATFTIFLFHMSFFYIYHSLNGWPLIKPLFNFPMFVFSIVACVSLWVFSESIKKAYLQTKLQYFSRVTSKE
jgi:hypothetical protein